MNIQIECIDWPLKVDNTIGVCLEQHATPYMPNTIIGFMTEAVDQCNVLLLRNDVDEYLICTDSAEHDLTVICVLYRKEDIETIIGEDREKLSAGSAVVDSKIYISVPDVFTAWRMDYSIRIKHPDLAAYITSVAAREIYRAVTGQKTE
ncbi:MAG: hypothetical protein IJ049_06165 [Oscillospiraceae bacterium]|nr:hypothetical protein [Oscillospiraceae bacterium]